MKMEMMDGMMMMMMMLMVAAVSWLLVRDDDCRHLTQHSIYCKY